MQERQCKVLEFKAYEVAEEVKLIFIRKTLLVCYVNVTEILRFALNDKNALTNISFTFNLPRIKTSRHFRQNA